MRKKNFYQAGQDEIAKHTKHVEDESFCSPLVTIGFELLPAKSGKTSTDCTPTKEKNCAGILTRAHVLKNSTVHTY
jgi:hypothetical protein